MRRAELDEIDPAYPPDTFAGEHHRRSCSLWTAKRSRVKGTTGMPAYLMIQIVFKAPRERFAPYRDAVGPLAATFGGRYIVRAG